ncbi:MAG: PspA/IM30 family protein [Spirochaetaceae bacterium]
MADSFDKPLPHGPGSRAEQADLSGMDRADAAAYVGSYITSLHQLRKQRQEAEERVALWKKRAQLAYDKQDRDLAATALAEWKQAEATLSRLQSEEADLSETVALMKHNLERLKRTPEMTVDAAALAQQLQEAAGNTKTQEAIRNLNVESELEQLKRKLQEEREQ